MRYGLIGYDNKTLGNVQARIEAVFSKLFQLNCPKKQFFQKQNNKRACIEYLLKVKW